METTHVIATALLLMTGAAVGVVAQNDTAPSDAANESDQPEPAANDTEANETAEEADEGEEDTVTVCHVPPGNPDARHTIEIGAPAWQAHEGHGDHKGACDEDAEDGDDASEDETEDSNETEASDEEENESEASDDTDEDENESDA